MTIGVASGGFPIASGPRIRSPRRALVRRMAPAEGTKSTAALRAMRPTRISSIAIGGIPVGPSGPVRPRDILPVGRRLAEVAGAVREGAGVSVGTGPRGDELVAEAGLVEGNVRGGEARRETHFR